MSLKNRRKPKSLCTVYGLYDYSGDIKYIGQTRQSLKDRLKWVYKSINRKRARNIKLSPVENWVDECLFQGIPITISSIDENSTWDVSEVIYIERYTSNGHKLLNVTRGGMDNLGAVKRENVRHELR